MAGNGNRGKNRFGSLRTKSTVLCTFVPEIGWLKSGFGPIIHNINLSFSHNSLQVRTGGHRKILIGWDRGS